MRRLFYDEYCVKGQNISIFLSGSEICTIAATFMFFSRTFVDMFYEVNMLMRLLFGVLLFPAVAGTVQRDAVRGGQQLLNHSLLVRAAL